MGPWKRFRGEFRINFFFSLLIATAFLFLSTTAGAILREDPKAVAQVAATTSSTEPPTTTTTLPAREANLPQIQLPAIPGGTLAIGSNFPEVQAYEQRLADMRFDIGTVDTKFDTQTQYAVHGLQKLLRLPITGRITVAEQTAMQNFAWPDPVQGDAPEATRVEVDVARQILILWHDSKVKLISTVSTGSGVRYCYIPKKGNTNVRICTAAWTPSGRYEFYYYVNGWHDGDLGRLYKPFYFNGGIAIHGYPSVPTTPASHGCTRIPMHTAEFFHTLVEKGTAVYVIGGTNGKPGTSYTPLPPTTTTTLPTDTTAVTDTTVPPTTVVPETTAPATTAPTTPGPPTP